MATWERRIYAKPGSLVHWMDDIKLNRPFFKNGDLFDAESCTVKAFTQLLVIACFPDAELRGALVLVPNNGLW